MVARVLLMWVQFCREVTHRQLSLGKYHWVFCFGISVWVDVRDCNAFQGGSCPSYFCITANALGLTPFILRSKRICMNTCSASGWPGQAAAHCAGAHSWEGGAHTGCRTAPEACGPFHGLLLDSCAAHAAAGHSLLRGMHCHAVCSPLVLAWPQRMRALVLSSWTWTALASMGVGDSLPPGCRAAVCLVGERQSAWS